MVAFRGANLRKGDLAEQLGLLMLQNMALVAPVPRTEDVGVDAVVTLLKRHDGHRLAASESFFAQLKARSVQALSFSGEEVTWLFSLELPYFVLSVDRQRLSAQLFCCHRLNIAAIQQPPDKLELLLETPEQDERDFPREVIQVGPPVLEWSMTDSVSEETFSLFYRVCSAHIEHYKKLMVMRRTGSYHPLEWRTNEVPAVSPFLFPTLSVGRRQATPESAEATFIETLQHMNRLSDDCRAIGDAQWLVELKKLLDKYVVSVARSSDS